MNLIVQTIVQMCADHPLQEKWLLAPTLRVGWQWIDAATKQGRPLVNLHCKTIQGAVLDAITPYLVKQELRFASRMRGVMLIESIWRQLDPENNYFGALEPNLALFERIHDSLQDLRASGGEDVSDELFESPLKAQTLHTLMKQFAAALHEANLIDYAEALRIACEHVEINNELVLFIPEDVELNSKERQFIHALSARHADVVDEGKPPKPKRDIDLLRWIEQPGDAAASFQDGSVSLYHAIGEANEVREIFRRCLQNKIPLDQIEIVFTDSETYIPLLYELSFEPHWTDEAHGMNLPITFVDGVPATYSKPGKALLAWIHWISQDYLQSALVSLYQDHLLQHDASTFSHDEMAQAVRRLPIGFGRERTLACIRDKIQSLHLQLDNIETTDDENTPATSPVRYRLYLEREISKYGLLLDEIDALLATTPHASGLLSDIVQKSLQFCERFTSDGSDFHRQGRERLVNQLKQLFEIIRADPNIKSVDGWELVASVPRSLSVLKSGPKPGHIHASHYLSGGHTDRPYLFIVGLDDGRFPGAGSQDPVVLDKERAAISPGLVTSRGRIQRKIQILHRLLKRLPGKATLSFSSFNVVDGREQFASPLVLSVHQIISGDHQADYSSLKKWLGAPASFAPGVEGQCVNERDMDLLNAAGGRCNSVEWIFERYSHVQKGMRARQHRQSNEFTVYDGWVADAGVLLNFTSGRIASASALETLGRCPLAFFFQYGLQIEEPESVTVEEEQWLDALAFGSLVHGLFERFIAERIKNNEPVSYAAHRQELIDMADRELESYRASYPPKAEHSFSRQRDQLMTCIEYFLYSEEELQLALTPQYVEAKIGYENDEAVVVSLPNGAQIKARGIIDRIDAVGDPTDARFAIWDYKTGGSYKYGKRQQKKKWDALQQGRVIQHALYTAMARQWLKRRVSADAEIEQFGYFFPSEKGKGERLTWSANELTQAGNVLLSLNQIASMGAFLATDDPEDCTFCEFNSICGDVESLAQCSAAKLQNPQTDRLAPMKELRNDEC
ncbi:MAG: PD-(D/E)XK nuclease family protein [Candidatus Hinthialibacter antarcticus]|nr:PD-(D/E)XK nuclease family protein [Candidatus Hinthialibacter antarcticus]